MRKIVAQALEERRSGLTFDEGARILEGFGIPVCRYAYADDEKKSHDFVAEVGYPVVAKIDAPDLHHRFELGAVITGIANPAELADALQKLRDVVKAQGLTRARILLQETLSGRELIFGMDRDPSFGPVVMFGIGGTFVEALKDVAFAVAPVTLHQASSTIQAIRAFPLLGEFRGETAVDIDQLGHMLSALGELSLALPEVVEIDLNPIIATPDGPAAVDILVALHAG